MSISIASNIMSLRVQGAMRKTTSELEDALQRASSGSRLIRPSADPAGFSLAESLRNQAKQLAVASRNATDGISFATVADAALSEIQNLLGRMSELATQATSSTYTVVQRSALQSEWVSLGSEIDRIVQTSSFNSMGVLNGTAPTIQIGTTNSADSRINMAGVTATLAALSLGSGSQLTTSLTGVDVNAAVTASRAAFTAISNATDALTVLRGQVTGNISRLEFAVNQVSVYRENLLAAEANLRDSDVAQDAAEILRLQILGQAQAALNAQANQAPSLILSLLQ